MKKIIFWLAFLTAFLHSTPSEAQSYLNRRYNNTSTCQWGAECNNALFTDTINYLIGKEYCNPRRGWLLKLDSVGNVLSDSILGTLTNPMQMIRIMPHNGDTLAAIFYNELDRSATFAFMNTDGDTLFTNKFDNPDPMVKIFPNCWARARDGGYWLGLIHTIWQFDVVKLNSQGIEEHRFSIRDTTASTNYFSAIGISLVEMEDSTLTLILNKQHGYEEDYLPDFQQRIWIVNVDRYGNKRWEYLTPSSKYVYCAGMRPIVLPDKSIVFGGASIVRNIAARTHYTTGYMGRIDHNHQLIWDNVYGTNNWTMFNQGQVMPNNDILVTGIVTDLFLPDSVRPSGWIMRLDDMGSIIWERRIVNVYGGTIDRFQGLGEFTIDSQKRIKAVGGIYDFVPGSPTQGVWSWLVRLDSVGCLIPGCHLPNDVDVSPEDAAISLKIQPPICCTFMWRGAPLHSPPLLLVEWLISMAGKWPVGIFTSAMANMYWVRRGFPTECTSCN